MFFSSNFPNGFSPVRFRGGSKENIIFTINLLIYQFKNYKIMKTKIENFLSELNTGIDVLNFIDIDNIDHSNAYDSIYEMIDDNNGFDVEIIYHSRAIEYLKECDPSLTESLELASEMGFALDDLNSEVLASLLASKNVRDDFYDLEDEINNFFLELEDEDE